MTSTQQRKNCVTAAASAFAFAGQARFFAGLFCYAYRFFAAEFDIAG